MDIKTVAIFTMMFSPIVVCALGLIELVFCNDSQFGEERLENFIFLLFSSFIPIVGAGLVICTIVCAIVQFLIDSHPSVEKKYSILINSAKLTNEQDR